MRDRVDTYEEEEEEEAMTKVESKRSSVAAMGAASEQVHNGPAESSCPGAPGAPASRSHVVKQASRESLYRKNAECEVYDDGTNTFFW